MCCAVKQLADGEEVLLHHRLCKCSGICHRLEVHAVQPQTEIVPPAGRLEAKQQPALVPAGPSIPVC